jgi:DNA-binding response OmpR family regulator
MRGTNGHFVRYRTEEGESPRSEDSMVSIDPAVQPPGQQSVLIVEDDALLASAIGLCVEQAGYAVAGMVNSVEAALSTLGRSQVDAALLDINLQGELVFPVANALAERGVPFVFVTAHGVMDIPETHRHRPLVSKPYLAAALHAALASVLAEPPERH